MTFAGDHGLSTGKNSVICTELRRTAHSTMCLPKTLHHQIHNLLTASLFPGSQPHPALSLGCECNSKEKSSAPVAHVWPVHPRRDFQWWDISSALTYINLQTDLECLQAKAGSSWLLQFETLKGSHRLGTDTKTDSALARGNLLPLPQSLGPHITQLIYHPKALPALESYGQLSGSLRP